MRHLAILGAIPALATAVFACAPRADLMQPDVAQVENDVAANGQAREQAQEASLVQQDEETQKHRAAKALDQADDEIATLQVRAAGATGKTREQVNAALRDLMAAREALSVEVDAVDPATPAPDWDARRERIQKRTATLEQTLDRAAPLTEKAPRR